MSGWSEPCNGVTHLDGCGRTFATVEDRGSIATWVNYSWLTHAIFAEGCCRGKTAVVQAKKESSSQLPPETKA